MSVAGPMRAVAPSMFGPSSMSRASTMSTANSSPLDSYVRSQVTDMLKDEKVKAGIATLLDPTSQRSSGSTDPTLSSASRPRNFWAPRQQQQRTGLPSTWKVVNSINLKPHQQEWESDSEAAARPRSSISYGSYSSLEDFKKAQDSQNLVNIYNARHCRTVCNTLARMESESRANRQPMPQVLNYTDKWGRPAAFDYSRDHRGSLIGSTCLIDKGRAQGDEMGEVLSHYPSVDFVVTSALPRTEESASHYLGAQKEDWKGGEKSGFFTKSDGSKIPYVSTSYLNETHNKDLSTDMGNVARIITDATRAGYKNILVSGHGNWQGTCSNMWESAGANRLPDYHQNGEHRIHTLKASDILSGASELDRYTGFRSSVTPIYNDSSSKANTGTGIASTVGSTASTIPSIMSTIPISSTA